MQTKYQTLVTMLAAIAVLAGSSARLWAQGGYPEGAGVPMTLTVTGTATVQGPDNGGDPIDKITTSTLKITTAWILQQIQTAEGTNFPHGAKLMLSDGTVNVTDSKGNVLLDASPYLSVSFAADGVAVWQGQVNNNTSAAQYTGSYLTTFTLTIGEGNSLAFSGLTKETYSLGALDKNGNQLGTDTITLTGAGDGQYNGNSVVVSGTLSATGRGTAGQ